MIDTYVLSFSFLGLAIFAVIHTIVFRFIDRRAIILWIQMVFLVALLILFAAWAILLLFETGWMSNPILLFEAMTLSIILYGFLSLLYLSAFGILESSIRIRILSEIALAGKSGIAIHKLREIYNRDVIVKKRLERFVTSGELTFDGRCYQVKKKVSLFWLPALYFRMFWKLYH